MNMELGEFLSKHFPALKEKAEQRFHVLDERDADEALRTFRGQFMSPKYHRLLKVVKTNEDPLERAKELDDAVDDSPIVFQSLMLSPGRTNLRGLGQQAADRYLMILIGMSLAHTGDANLVSDLEAINRLWDRILERDVSDRGLRAEEESELRKKLAPDTIINIEALIAELRKLKEPEKTGQYL